MRYVLFAILAAALLAAGGCGPAKPMSESEFKGFCYQYNGSRKAGCGDIISICDEYTPVISLKQASLESCLSECQAVYRPQAMRYVSTDCMGGAENSRDWCQRFCRTNYPR